MTFELRRQPTTDYCTLGSLFLDGVFFCFTLEPSEHAVHPDVPLGTYKVIVTYSTRFKRLLPLVVNVPGRLGIRVHPGNFGTDSEGCILLGMEQSAESVEQSRAACELFQSKIAQPLSRGETVTLQIVNAPVEALKA